MLLGIAYGIKLISISYRKMVKIDVVLPDGLEDIGADDVLVKMQSDDVKEEIDDEYLSSMNSHFEEIPLAAQDEISSLHDSNVSIVSIDQMTTLRPSLSEPKIYKYVQLEDLIEQSTMPSGSGVEESTLLEMKSIAERAYVRFDDVANSNRRVMRTVRNPYVSLNDISILSGKKYEYVKHSKV